MHLVPLRRHLARVGIALLVFVSPVLSGGVLQAQGTQAKRPVSYDMYDSWKSIGGTRLSDDGQWLAYTITSRAEDGEMVIRNLRTNRETRHPRGTGPIITSDSKYILFTVVPPRADSVARADSAAAAGGRAGGAPAAGAPAAGGGGRGGAAADSAAGGAGRNSLVIMTLADGRIVSTIDQVSGFRMPEASAMWVAIQKGRAGAGGGRGGRGGAAGGGGGRGAGGAGGGGAAAGGRQGGGGAAAAGRGGPAARRKDPGSDLILRNLATGFDTTLTEVSEYAWDKTGSLLVFAVSSADSLKDAIHVRRMSDGNLRTLQKGRGNYKSIAFDEGFQQLTFLSDQAEYAQTTPRYRIYYWKIADPAATEIVSATTAGIPQGMIIADGTAPRITEDGKRVYLSVAPPPPPPVDSTKPAPLRVDLWHFQDPMLQPMQQVRAAQDRNRTYRAVWHLAEKRLVALAAPDLPNVNPGRQAEVSLGTSDLAYRKEISWDQTYNDVYLVDLRTGKRTRIFEHWGATATLSPTGKYVLYFDESNGNWFSHRVADGVRTNLTEKLGVSFRQENHDTPDVPGPYGTGGWTADDKAVVLHDRTDIWHVNPDGSGARTITNGEGRKLGIVFRYRSMNPEEQSIPTTGTVLLTATDERTRATGFYRLALGGTAVPQKLIMADKALGAPTKAKNADVVVMTQSRFNEFPDLWVTNMSFTNPVKVSNANPQQNEVVWGNAELIDYINADGKKLRAMLIKPDNFDPTKKYPLMVYIYEELSQGLHGYRAPNIGTSINISRYVSNGYVVLQPDIVYDTGFPGESAEKCVIPAVNTVVNMGYIDPKRIGIQGHSWGGYQITHLITRTDLFAAVEAGASVANMISAYGGIRWGTGMSRAFQYEKTQSRIGAPPWDEPLKYIENSPIFWVENVKTPYLTIHNDADDAVPWYQAIEFFSALRRLDKEAYFFNYNGERHGLSNRDNMQHWTVHMDEFFDHYLLGKPKPEWMQKGVPFLERGMRDVRPLFKKPEVKATTTTMDPTTR